MTRNELKQKMFGQPGVKVFETIEIKYKDYQMWPIFGNITRTDKNGDLVCVATNQTPDQMWNFYCETK